LAHTCQLKIEFSTPIESRRPMLDFASGFQAPPILVRISIPSAYSRSSWFKSMGYDCIVLRGVIQSPCENSLVVGQVLAQGFGVEGQCKVLL
jgi:hypothetical protein